MRVFLLLAAAVALVNGDSADEGLQARKDIERHCSASDTPHEVRAALQAVLSGTATHVQLPRDNGGSRLDDTGAHAVADAIRYDKVTELTLDLGELSVAGVAALCEAMVATVNLRVLKLHNYKPKYTKRAVDGVAVARVVAKMLAANQGIQSLNLYRIFVEDEGAELIAEALKANTALQKLDLDSNGVADAGALAIAGMLEVNVGLVAVDLDSNRISDSGGGALVGALKKNPRVLSLSLSDNNIGDAGAKGMAQALETDLPRLTELLLDDNMFGQDGRRALSTALGTNTR
jgi:Ran GTPase-activating protein 1